MHERDHFKLVTPESVSHPSERGLRDAESTPASRPIETPPVPAAPAVFVERALVERLMGDVSAARTVAEVFLQDLPRQILALDNTLACGDAKGVERQAHTIKGAASAVSGLALAEVACGIEGAGRTGDLETARGSMDTLKDKFRQLRIAMEQSGLLQRER